MQKLSSIHRNCRLAAVMVNKRTTRDTIHPCFHARLLAQTSAGAKGFQESFLSKISTV
jgi:hypothetical protein